MENILNLDSWLNNWMPMIRAKLDFIDDDGNVIVDLIEMGIDNAVGIDHSIQIAPKVIAFGAGPNLDIEFDDYVNILNNSKNIISHQTLAADGAAHKLIENNIIPDYIFTDLDGLDIELLIDRQIKSTIFILAHGDNKSIIETLFIKNVFSKYQKIGKIIWCTQGHLFSNWINTLGFTDGDRGICFVIGKQSEVFLLGYDLHAKRIGRWSKKPHTRDSPMSERKMLKLGIAAYIFEELNKNGRLFSQSSKKVPSRFMKINEFLQK